MRSRVAFAACGSGLLVLALLAATGERARADSPSDPVASRAPRLERSATLEKTKFLAFGDSITQGVLCPPTCSPTDLTVGTSAGVPTSYPARLKALLEARYPSQTISMINVGVGGESTTGGRARIGSELDTHRPDVLLLLEGINGLSVAGQPVTRQISPAEAAADLRAMVQAAKSRGVSVLIATLTWVTDAREALDPGRQAAVDALNVEIHQLAAQLKIAPVVDLFAATVGKPALFGIDGLHPSIAGYNVLAQTFFDAIVSRFEAPAVADVTVTKTGDGAGIVISSPPGINCGVDCAEELPTGTPVTLSAWPAAGSVFAGWDGPCSGVGDCEVTLDGDASITAAFELPVAPPPLALTPATLQFGAVQSGASLGAQTDGQVVQVIQEEGTPLGWSAASSHPAVLLTAADGAGTGSFRVDLVDDGSLPASGLVMATVTITVTGPSDAAILLPVQVQLFEPGTTGAPVGVVDTPLANLTGVTGSLGVTGWAVDDIQVEDVEVWRDPVESEATTGLIFVGRAVFVDGARPDVAGDHPTRPLSNRAGWGFLVLTNALPHQGNGAFTLHVFASDRDGHDVLLGSRTFVADNASATTPFGAIDTPAQGETIGSGSVPGAPAAAQVVNFGWALTPLPAAIPADGSTIVVFIDGVPVGSVDYDHRREDIATLFPGLANSNGAGGFRILDSAAYANGVHTIAWSVTDNNGQTTGIGSRFFGVLNAGGAARRPPPARSGRSAPSVGVAPDTILVRRGYDLERPAVVIYPDPRGTFHVLGRELERLEIGLETSATPWRGALVVGDERHPLPIGSTLDPGTGTFAWQPGVGHVGAYPLVFTRRGPRGDPQDLSIRVVLAPMYAEQVTPLMAVDLPAGGDVSPPFVVAGWAIDRAGVGGTGVDAVHVWAYPATGAPPIFLGAAPYGGSRPDVGALYGPEALQSGFGLVVASLPGGAYDLAVFAHSSVTGTFSNARVVRIRVP